MSVFSLDRNRYGFEWREHNESFVPSNGYGAIYRAFQYRSAESLNNLPIYSKYGAYIGGGHIYELRGKLSYIIGNLTKLEEMNWIDRQTRAIFVEFSIYNPNINLVMVSTIQVEFLASGNILTKATFDPVSLFNEANLSGSVSGLLIAFELFYMIFIVYFMVVEIKQLAQLGFKAYSSQFWSYIEWSIIICSWVAFSIFFYKLYADTEVLEFFKKTSGYAYINLQRLAYWNQVLSYTLAFCCVFGTIKFLKLLRFNQRINSLGLTLMNCIKELLNFGVIFGVLWFAFIQLMYLFFSKDVYGYRTMARSMETSFEIMLGKFEVQPLINSNTTFGPLLFMIYNVVMVLMLLNLFISIVTDSFEKVKNGYATNEIEIVEFLKERFKKIVNFNRKRAMKKIETEKANYNGTIESFSSRTNELLCSMAKVNGIKGDFHF